MATASLAAIIRCSISVCDSVVSLATSPVTWPSWEKSKSGSTVSTASAPRLTRAASSAAATSRAAASGAAHGASAASSPAKMRSTRG